MYSPDKSLLTNPLYVRKLLRAMVHAKFGGRAGSSEEKFAMIVYF